MNIRFLFLFVALGCGTAFGQAQYTVLWSFGSVPNDGFQPVSSLIFDQNGNLYGTTEGGGANCCATQSGIVFELSPTGNGGWTETILYNFCSKLSGDGLCLDGAHPLAGLVFDSAGNLYGTTYSGGAYDCQNGLQGCGTVFELSPSSQGGAWTETVLYNFCAGGLKGGCQDGAEPSSQLTMDTSGNLYGTTTTGGAGGMNNVCCWGGTVFELSHSGGGWTHTVLYNFCVTGHDDICPDGSGPQAGVTFDRAGNLYGTTEGGGYRTDIGNGTVYELSPGSNGWKETVLSPPELPIQKGGKPLGEVSLDSLGNVYSTFSFGGTNAAGGLFRYNPRNRKFTTFSFNGINGQTPSAGVLIDSGSAAIYGTTFVGGANRCGTVFKMVAPVQETVLYSFGSQPNLADGCGPLAALIADKSGNLYGTTKIGGANGQGVVFEITPQAASTAATPGTLRSLRNTSN